MKSSVFQNSVKNKTFAYIATRIDHRKTMNLSSEMYH